MLFLNTYHLISKGTFNLWNFVFLKTILLVLHNGIGHFPLLWASQLRREEDPPSPMSFPTLSVQFLCCVILLKDLPGGNLERWMDKQANHHSLVFPSTLESEGLWPRREYFCNLLGVKIWNKVSRRKETEETLVDPWPIKYRKGIFYANEVLKKSEWVYILHL